MKISTFPKAKALPESKEEKNENAWYTSKPHLPEIVEISTEDDLIDIICNRAWSPSIFTEFRTQDNFISTDFIVLDIDEDMTIEEAEEKVHELDLICICIPSTSHSEENHRFRLIFPTLHSIKDKRSFEATNNYLADHFPADPSCLTDTARFFFGGKLVDGFFYEDGSLLKPVKPEKVRKQLNFNHEIRDYVSVGESIEELVESLYGEKRNKVPEQISYFLENAPDNLSGEWFHASNRFLFTCGLIGIEESIIMQVFFKLYPHEELTDKKVAKIIQQGYNKSEEK